MFTICSQILSELLLWHYGELIDNVLSTLLVEPLTAFVKDQPQHVYELFQKTRKRILLHLNLFRCDRLDCLLSSFEAVAHARRSVAALVHKGRLSLSKFEALARVPQSVAALVQKGPL